MLQDFNSLAQGLVGIRKSEITPRTRLLHAKARYYYREVVNKLKHNRQIFEYLDDEYRYRNDINSQRYTNSQINQQIQLETKYEAAELSPTRKSTKQMGNYEDYFNVSKRKYSSKIFIFSLGV
jgi:hypothetical protein